MTGLCSRPDQQVDELDQQGAGAAWTFEKATTASWASILDTIRDRIDPFRLEDVCRGCRWLDLDYCTNGLADLAGIQVADD